MGSINQDAIFLTILGPTGVGKTELARQITKQVDNCVILSADAMAVYKGMDIGTAKLRDPNCEVYGVDLVFSYQEFNLFLYKSYCSHVLNQLASQKKKVILCGGSALYIRSIVDDLDLPGKYPEERRKLEIMLASGATDLETLYQRLKEVDYKAAQRIQPQNARRIIRALEVIEGSKRPFSSYGQGLKDHPPKSYKIIGLKMEQELLKQVIVKRLKNQIEQGFVTEVKNILNSGGFSRTSAIAHGYLEIANQLTEKGHVDIDVVIEQTLKRILSFTKRQMQWFRRDPRVVWFDVTPETNFQTLAQDIVAMIYHK